MQSVVERAEDPYELLTDPALEVDVEWYKKQQVHPFIASILAPLEGIDAALIAECLGVDTAAEMDEKAFSQSANVDVVMKDISGEGRVLIGLPLRGAADP